MNEQNKKQIIVFGALILVLGAVLGKSLMSSPNTAAALPTNAAGGMTNAVAGTAVNGSVFEEIDVEIKDLVQNIKEVSFDYSDSHLARNPSAPLVGANAIFSKVYSTEDGEVPSVDNVLYEANRKRITGIIWDKDAPVAVIDNEVVSVGYRFEEPISVKAIGRDHVVLTIVNEGLDIVRELKEQ